MRGSGRSVLESDSAAWVASLILHLLILAALTLATFSLREEERPLVLSAISDVELEDATPQEFDYADEISPQVGTHEAGGVLAAHPVALERFDTPELREPEFPEIVSEVQIQEQPTAEVPRGPFEGRDAVIRGAGTIGASSTIGAVDRITHEILLSLDQRPTLVVWLFDSSGSMRRQREAVRQRFERIYEELGVIEASSNPAFAKHEDKPLLTSVVAFGERVDVMTPKPTDNIDEIQAAVASIERMKADEKGIENVFTAVCQVGKALLPYRIQSPKRNVMFVIFTDEAGDDPQNLDQAVMLCRKYQIPVYVVGVPAPFGRQESEVKYIDPNPNFDQTPIWAPVHQGPESLFPERIKLHFAGIGRRDDLFDSGFGPFGLTRLALESGGMYFAVHPDRTTGKRLGRNDITELAAHFARFFDPTVMRKYRPDYVSVQQYEQLLRENRARRALVEAARLSWVTPLEAVRTNFPRRDEASLSNLLSLAQRDAAKLEPKVNAIYETLREGEADRPKLHEPRWEAGYDLAMGRALAVKVRTEGYNAMLARAKNMKFKDPKSDTWRLRPADTITIDSLLAKQAKEAKTYLERVVKEHPDTPWSVLAVRELRQPFGWAWSEHYAGVSVPRQREAGGNGRGPRDDKLRVLTKPKPRRKPPAL